MDVVYTLKHDPRSKNKQLVYSLRSIEKHLTGVRNVYVIGSEPGLPGVIHIPATDTKSPAVNIKDKLMIACDTLEISEDFLYIADDHFINADCPVSDYPTFSHGTLTNLAKIQSNSYKTYVLNTAKILIAAGMGEVNYNIHSPIIYNKERLKAAVASVEWNGLGCLLKSLYGNFCKIPGTPMNDLKISRDFPIAEMHAKIAGRPVFSTGREFNSPNIGRFLAELYPNPSRWERPNA